MQRERCVYLAMKFHWLIIILKMINLLKRQKVSVRDKLEKMKRNN